jgi:serine/threonine protein kinase
MQAERWRRISGIFKSALDLEPDERPAYLSAECGNDETLRQEVERLIESHQRASEENFIDSPELSEIAPLLDPESEEADSETDRLAKGQQLSHYRIIKKLGVGGMGEVYLAEDIRLARTIALKILPAEVASDKRRMQRFKQEAQLASSLNQPNILTIFEFGEVDGVHFIASEYVDGITLRPHLKDRQPRLPEIIDLGIQVVAALDAAHEAQVIHRDIKPENIMVRRRDQVVKVLDFGLAKLTEKTSGLSRERSDTEANTKLLVRTMPGTVMGTVNYMSPEQAQGLHVDERTDLWSVGVLIYEMVAGCVPFAGLTSSHTIVEIIEKDPPPLAAMSGRKVPNELERIVSKSLAKNRDERYQTAKDMLIDLRNLKRRLELDAELERSSSPEPILAPSGKYEAPSTNSTAARQFEPSESERTRPWKLLAATAVSFTLVAGLITAGIWWQRRNLNVAAPASSTPGPELKLSYWMTVQKYKDGRPFQSPFRLAGEINFEKDYQVKLNVSSPQAGYLYILNEGPASSDGSSFVVLFPSRTANEGLSRLAENEKIEIPDRSWFKFDAEQGLEKLWLIFSRSPLSDLESSTQFANQKDQGLIKDANLNAKVREFLRTQAPAKATVEKDDELNETSLKISGPLLIHLIKLEHH